MQTIPSRLRIGLCVLAAFHAASHAQGPTSITSDGTLGTIVTQTGNVFDIDGGTISGANQFHSLGNFSVGTEDIASFNGPGGTENIVTRITGGMISDIDGTVGSAIPGANLYLLNPAGILIGPNAQLSVDGSFHASTADYLKFGDSGIFFADPSGTSVLSAAPPSAFGFLNASPAPIDVATPNLIQVAPGETLSFVGGNLTLGAPDGSAPAYVLAPGGNVNLVSTGSAGEALIEADGSISADGFAQLGDVRLQGDSIVDGKNVYIRAGQLVIDNGVILPGAFSFFELAPPPDGGTVDIKVANDVTLTGTAPDPLLGQRPGIAAFAGDFSTGTAPAATVPDISIEAGSLTVSGAGTIEVARVGPGDPGVVTIEANTVEVRDGGTISALNAFDGPGTSVSINAQDVTLDGSNTPEITEITTASVFHPAYPVEVDPALTTATSGSITINATNDLVVRNAQITSDGQSFGGSADINLTAANATFDSDGTLFDSSGGTSGPTRTLVSTQSSFAGDSGDVTLDVDGKLEIANGAVISVNTLGSGNGGTLTVTAAETEITGQASGLASQSVPPIDEQLDAFAQVYELPDFASLRDALGLPPEADLFDVLSTLNDFGFTAVNDLTAGDGGTISVTTPKLTISGQDAAVDTSTAWDGNGGNVLLNVGNLVISDSGTIGSRSGIPRIDTGEIFVGTGNGGDISITASSAVSLQNGASISSRSLGTGLAGNVSVNAGQTLDMSGSSSISTQATVSDGGNIEVIANEQVYLLQSDITTSVESGLGGGGNINIDPKFVILNQSNILANAFGGPGGNISIVAGNFIVTPDSVIDASSALGLDGTVNISSPDEEIADDLAVLPDNFLDVTSLMSDRCGATAGASSLVDAGPGGLAVDPDGYLPSFASATKQEDQGKGARKASLGSKRWWTLDAADPALKLAKVTCTY